MLSLFLALSYIMFPSPDMSVFGSYLLALSHGDSSLVVNEYHTWSVVYDGVVVSGGVDVWCMYTCTVPLHVPPINTCTAV